MLILIFLSHLCCLGALVFESYGFESGWRWIQPGFVPSFACILDNLLGRECGGSMVTFALALKLEGVKF